MIRGLDPRSKSTPKSWRLAPKADASLTHKGIHIFFRADTKLVRVAVSSVGIHNPCRGRGAVHRACMRYRPGVLSFARRVDPADLDQPGARGCLAKVCVFAEFKRYDLRYIRYWTERSRVGEEHAPCLRRPDAHGATAAVPVIGECSRTIRTYQAGSLKLCSRACGRQ